MVTEKELFTPPAGDIVGWIGMDQERWVAAEAEYRIWTGRQLTEAEYRRVYPAPVWGSDGG